MNRVEQHPVITEMEALLPELASRAVEMEEARRLPADMAEKMAKAGLFRIVTPEVYGGYELPPMILVDVVRRIAEVNASAAWCVMIAATTGMNASYMDPEFAQQVFGDPMAITGGAFAPTGKAVIDGDDFIVTGRWQWNSGSANCTWLCGGSMIYENDELRRLPNGRPDHRMMWFPADEAELIDTWKVMGLKGTGSGDMAVTEVRVPKARSVSLISDPLLIKNPLYTFPSFGLLALGVASVALGNMAGALNEFTELAKSKGPMGSKATLSEKSIFQSELARLTAVYRSARAYFEDEIAATWETACEHGEISLERRAALRLACTHVVRMNADVCRAVYDLGGGAALFLSNPLQRRLRDSMANTQHISTAPVTWELVGRLLFGLETDTGMV